MKSAAWRVGLFALAGLVLLVLAVLGGGPWFKATERATMRFDSSVFGLQEGAPLVLRGVRVGQVTSVSLAPGGANGVAVPVLAELDRALLVRLLAAGSPDGEPALPQLIAQGLFAKLALQSLLTGQLYVDLDIDPARPAPPPQPADGPPLIPTRVNPLQSLQAQIEKLDVAQLGQDLSELARSARELMAGPQPLRTLQRAADAAAAIEQLAQRLQTELVPLAAPARQTLAQTRRTMQQLGLGAQQVGDAASSLQAQARGLGDAAQPLLADLRRSADELARAATALRESVAADSTLRQGAERTLHDVSAAARALRELSEAIDRNPELLLRGRADANPPP
jgi:paraquat-inducible protein B